MKIHRSKLLFVGLILLMNSFVLFSRTITTIGINDSIYAVRQELKPSFFNKIFGRLSKKNAFVDINNLLATKPMMEVSAVEVTAIVSKYKVKVTKFKGDLLDLYKIYLKHCFGDMLITDDETKNLNHLKLILNLTNSDTDRLFDDIAFDSYKIVFKEIISNGKIDNSEQETLEKLKITFHLPKDSADKFESVAKLSFVTSYLSKAIADKRLSPNELNEFESISKNLGVQVEMNENKKAELEKYKMYWLVENGDIPVLKAEDVSLQKGEKCFFYTKCDFYEVRNVTKSINYSGYVHTIKVGRGCYYRSGTTYPERIKSKELMLLDAGALYLTNKRLIYVGSNKNISIRLTNILTLTPFSDGVEISKESGRNPIFKFNADSELFAMILTRLINE